MGVGGVDDRSAQDRMGWAGADGGGRGWTGWTGGRGLWTDQNLSKYFRFGIKINSKSHSGEKDPSEDSSFVFIFPPGAKCRVGVVRTYIGNVGTELCCETMMEKCTIG